VEEVVAKEAGVPVAAIRIEDPELRPPSRRTGSIAGDDHLRSLPHDIPPQADPRPASQLQAYSQRLAERRGHARGEPRRLEHDEQDPGPASEGGETVEAIRDPPGAGDGPGRQVEDERVHRPGGEERPRHRQALVE
jgi:hypothetical protein